MNLIRQSILFPVLLCLTEAAIRSFYLRDISLGTDRQEGPELHQIVLCLFKSPKPLKCSYFAQQMLDTRSCTVKEITDEVVEFWNKRIFWEIFQEHDLYISRQHLQIKSSKPYDAAYGLFIITFDQASQSFEIRNNETNYVMSEDTNRICVSNVTDLVYCPGGEKPLRFISAQSISYSFKFPEFGVPDVYRWKDQYEINLKFLHCDQTSGIVLPISKNMIYNGTWETDHPEIQYLTTTSHEILTVSLEPVTQTIYWMQKSHNDIHLYRMGYGMKEKREKEHVNDMETAYKYDDFVVHYSEQCMYACGEHLLCLSMSTACESNIAGDPSLLKKKCSALALFEDTLYIRWEDMGMTVVYLKSGPPYPKVIGKRCKGYCRTQVVRPAVSLFQTGG